MVEAAMVIPLLILIIVGIIACSMYLENKVEKNSYENQSAAKDILVDDITNIEDLLRGSWILE